MLPPLPIVRIQRHCLHDGPGVRTTLFLQGCALACPWCANPESIPLSPVLFFDREKCMAQAQPDAPLCVGCSRLAGGAPSPNCPLHAVRPSSKPMDIESVLRHLLKDAALYRDSGGGITLSGGEPFLHAETLRPLAQRLKEKAIPIAIETSGYFPPAHAALLLPFIDHVLLDLKILAPPIRNPEISLPEGAFEANLSALARSPATLTYRLLLIREFMATPKKREEILARIQRLPAAPLELLPLHHLAESKYRQLGRPFSPLSAPGPSECETFRDQLQARLQAPVKLLAV